MRKALTMLVGACATLAVLLCASGFPAKTAAAKDPPKTPVGVAPMQKSSPSSSEPSGTTKTPPSAATEVPLAPVPLQHKEAPVSPPAVPPATTSPSAGEAAPGVKHFEPVSPAAAPAASGADATKKEEKPAGSAPVEKNVGVPKVIPLSDQEKASIKQKFGKPEIESTRPTKTEGAAAAAPSPTPVRRDLLHREDRIPGTAGERLLSPKELGQMADKLVRLLDALERTGPKAAVGGLPDSTGSIPGFPGGSSGQAGDLMDRFDRTGPNLPGPASVTPPAAGPMPDNNPLGGHTAQEMFEHQSGATSPGKEAGGGIKLPVASVKSEGGYDSFFRNPNTGEYAGHRSTYNSSTGILTTKSTYGFSDGSTAFVTTDFSYSTGYTILRITEVDAQGNRTSTELYAVKGGEFSKTPPVPELEPLGPDEVEITEADVKIKTPLPGGESRLPAELLPTLRQAAAAIRAAAGTSDPNVTTPQENDGTGGGGSVDPGKMNGSWVKQPIPEDTGPPPVVSPGSNVDTESVRPQPVPAPIDPVPLDGQQHSPGAGE